MLTRKEINSNFLEFTNNYEQSSRVTLKKNHILRVAKNCENIAISLGLSDELVNLAYVIGIAHDLGRYEQVRIHNTFSDAASGMNHALESVRVLFDMGFVRKLIDTDKYDEIIRAAVINHNKNTIEGNLNEDEMLFAKIIRDADKLDILYVITFESLQDIFWSKTFEGEYIDKSFILHFYAHKLLNYKDIKRNLEHVVAFYNYIYDLNFEETARKVLEGDYYKKFNDRLKKVYTSPRVHEQLDNLLLYATNYLKRKENS